MELATVVGSIPSHLIDDFCKAGIASVQVVYSVDGSIGRVTGSNLAIMWNWYLKKEGRKYRRFWLSSSTPTHKFMICRNSSISIGRLARDGLPCRRTSFFFTAFSTSITRGDLVGFPVLCCTSHPTCLLGIK
jgi:hypothetical protein